MRRGAKIILCLMVVVSCSWPSSSDPVIRSGANKDKSLQYVDSILWTRLYDTEVKDNYAYCSFANGLVVVDISDKTKPREIAKLYLGGGSDIKLQDNLAYIAAREKGLAIVDIGSPNRPHLLASIDTPGEAREVLISGNYAYVADGEKGVHIINVKDPATPKLVKTVATNDYAAGLFLSKNHLYVADGEEGLLILHMNNRHPVKAGTCDTPGTAEAVVVSGKYAYVADGLSGMQVIDVKNTKKPKIISNVIPRGSTHGVTLSRDKKYVFTGHYYDGGLSVVDISKPDQAQIVKTFQYPIYNEAQEVTIIGNTAFVSDYFSGLWMMDISNPIDPKMMGVHYTPASILCTAAGKAGIYAAGDLSGFNIVNVNNPSNLKLTGYLFQIRRGHELAASANYAFLTDRFNDIIVFDVTEADKPKKVKTMDLPGSAREIKIQEDYAYVTADHGGLHLVNISNPLNPTLESTYKIGGYAYGLAVRGQYAYMAKSDSGKLLILDISNPKQPRLLSQFKTPGLAYGVAVQNNFAYVADGESGMQIIDISAPKSPKLTGGINTPDFAYAVAIDGSFAYVADNKTGILKIDVSNPVSPKLVNTYNTPGEAVKLMIHKNHIYVADTYSLMVLTK